MLEKVKKNYTSVVGYKQVYERLAEVIIEITDEYITISLFDSERGILETERNRRQGNLFTFKGALRNLNDYSREIS